MKFSNQTLLILKNFQNIHKSLLFREGSELRTISETGTIFAIAKIEEVIPKEAGIHELGKLLSVLSLHDDPDVNFGENSFEITDSSKRKKTKITYVNTSLMKTLPPATKLPSMTDIDVQFTLSAVDFTGILKSANNLGLGDFVVYADGDKMYVGADNVDDISSDRYYIELGESDMTFRFVVKTEHLKFISADYTITIGNKKATFANDVITYYIALESKKSKK